jgi:hypothetical protein
MGDPAADDREDGSDAADLVLRNGEVVAVEDDQVVVEARFDRPQRLVVEEPAVAARRRLQRLLTGDLLPRVDGLSEEVLAGDQEPERDERIRRDDVTAVGVEPDRDSDGRAAVREAVSQFFATLKGLRREIVSDWTVGDRVIQHLLVTCTRPDDSQVTVPAVNLLRVDGERIGEYLIYVDLAPLYG